MAKITNLTEATEVFTTDLIPVVQNNETKSLQISKLSKLYESQLHAVSESGKTGWRLYGKIADNYGDIGEQAVDLSTSTASSIDYGAMGDYSISTGFKTKAVGDMSASFGDGTIALNNTSLVFGSFNKGTSTETVMEIGIGADNANRKNAVEVYTDGTITAPETSSTKIQARGNKTLVTLEYLFSAEFGNALPTTDPGNPGVLWNDSGVIKVSL